MFELAPRIILDGAHSPSSIEASAREARKLAGSEKLAVMLGMARDKNLDACIAPVQHHADEVLFVRYESPRSCEPAEMLAAAGGRGRTALSVKQGLEEIRGLAGRKGLVLVTGSFYLAGEARAILVDI